MSEIEKLDREYSAGFRWLLVFDVVAYSSIVLWWVVS